MPTRKDKTNVAPIYREQVFIPASGTTLMKQQARPKVAGRPVSSGAVEIVSPEFDLLTGIRGIANLPKGFLKTNKLPQGENLYYRQLDKSSKGLERAKQVGVIDTKSSGGANFTTFRGTTLRIGKTFDTPFFAKGSLWYNNVDDMDVIVGKDNPLLDWKMITQHGRVTENAIKAANRRTPFYNGATNQAPTELFELYRRYPGIGYRNVTYGFPTIPITGLNTVAEQMKCGGRRKAQLGLDIREGGVAIPIAPNMYYMDGRSHDNGGIAIGPNNKNGLEVEGGEVVKVGKNDVKVFSSVPLLRGVSPAQLVMGGANPDTVFKAQEEFKDRNRINDDGTRYEVGGEKIYTPSKSIQRQIQETGKITIGGAPTIGGLRTAKYVKGLATAKGYAKQANKIFTKVNNFVNNSLQGLINKHKITPNQADAYKKFYNEIVGVNGVNIPKTVSLFVNNENKEMKAGGIYIKPSKRGTFTAAATKHGMGVQEFANKVLANKEDYSPAMIKKANFARNASRWKKEYGGNMIYTINGNVRNGLMSARPKAEWGKGKDEKKWKIKANPKITVYSQITPYGRIDSDGESYIVVNDENVFNTFPNFMNEAIKHQTNKRPQYYAEKRLPIAGSQSIAEKVGLARSGWSYGENPTFDYVPSINLTVPENYSKGVASSTPRGRGTKTPTSKSKSASKPSTKGTDVKYGTPLKEKKESLYMTGIKNNSITPLRAGMEKIKSPSSTGGGTQSKNTPWIGQYKTFRPEDWAGLGTNLAGHIAGYFANNSLLKKYPMPVKPVLFQAAKLKTTHNINPKLATSRETEQMNLAEVGRNTSSSSTSIARKQRIMNEARDARNKLYGEKENIETQLINLDRRNRQDVYNRNISAYNDWLDKTYIAKTNKLSEKQKNIMSLISGIPSVVNHTLGVIENRRNTNNTLRAIAAANPNVDARQIGGFDYYEAIGPDGTHKALYDKHQRFVRYI